MTSFKSLLIHSSSPRKGLLDTLRSSREKLQSVSSTVPDPLKAIVPSNDTHSEESPDSSILSPRFRGHFFLPRSETSFPQVLRSARNLRVSAGDPSSSPLDEGGGGTSDPGGAHIRRGAMGGDSAPHAIDESIERGVKSGGCVGCEG